jgi:hypothetical protein
MGGRKAYEVAAWMLPCSCSEEEEGIVGQEEDEGDEGWGAK